MEGSDGGWFDYLAKVPFMQTLRRWESGLKAQKFNIRP
jgi:hypothetical protein